MDDQPLDAPPIAGEVGSGDRERALVALRDRLAAQIDATASGRDVAALSLRLVDVLNELKKSSPPAEKSPVDEIAARRANRRTSGPAVGE